VAIERADVERAARLARLELGEEETALFTKQLARIVEYVGKLSELDVAGVEPMAHASEEALLREDVPRDGLARKDALAGAPSATDGFFRVPPVIDPGH